MMNYYVNMFIACVVLIAATSSCSKNNDPAANRVTLHFNNTFGEERIVLGDASSSMATKNTSVEGQVHHFSELKYVISNMRLIKENGDEFLYHINDLDKGAQVIDQAKPLSYGFVLENVPSGEYKELRFGLGVRADLNTLDQERFPSFYAAAGKNDTEMMWEWGTGYRFTKIEGFYDSDNKGLSIHTGSTVEGEADNPSTYVPGVDAYREIRLTLPTGAAVGSAAPTIRIRADFDHLLSGKSHRILLDLENATPNVHTAVNMGMYVDNLKGMFSIEEIRN